MFNVNNPFNQTKDYDFNYLTQQHRQKYNQMTPLPNTQATMTPLPTNYTSIPQFTPTPLRTEEEKRNYIYNVGVMQKVLKEFKEQERQKNF